MPDTILNVRERAVLRLIWQGVALTLRCGEARIANSLRRSGHIRLTAPDARDKSTSYALTPLGQHYADTNFN